MSKSRYDPLVKLKKKDLDTAERALVGANNILSSATDKLNRAYEELSQMRLPTQGSVGEFTQATSMIHTQHQMIEQAQQALHLAQERQRKIREQFKAAMIDYEKFKYLEVQELDRRLKHLKTQEAKMLDEIGTMTYKREIL
jgi:flagellar export protein FliJ